MSNRMFLVSAIIPFLFPLICKRNTSASKNRTSNVLKIIERKGLPVIAEKSSFSYYNKYISKLHQEAFDLFRINNDTSFISTCTIIDEVSFEGGAT